MAINFPDSPNNGDSFTSNNKTWVFDGTVWNITSGTNSVADGAITTAKIDTGAVTAVKIASGAAVSNIGYTPANVASPTFTGTVVLPSTTSIGTVSNTEIGYVDGVTSAIQTQLDSKLTAATDTTSNRNVVINGAMQVAQRGTSRTSITGGDYYTADRFVFAPDSMGTWTNTVESDAPTGSGLRNSFKVLCTTADAAPAAGDVITFETKLEGQNVQQFAKGTAFAKQFALSFWVKSNVTGTYIAELLDSDNSRSVSASYTISASATWEKKTITFPADTTGVLNNDNATSLVLLCFLGAGTNYTSGTLATTWASATTANRAVGQTNLAAATSNYWQITGVQLEAGAVATPFEFEDFGTTLAKCQRYYEWGVASGSGYAQITAIFDAGSTSNIDFKVSKRAVPTMTNMSLSGNQYPNNQSNSVPRYENGHTRAFRYTTEHNTAFWNVTTGNGGSTGVAGHQIIWNASAEL